MTRGEIRWYSFRPPDKRRPVLILARNEVVERLNEVVVVPATRTIRGLGTEVLLSPEDGMPTTCALNFDHVSLAQRDRIGDLILTWLRDRPALSRHPATARGGFTWRLARPPWAPPCRRSVARSRVRSGGSPRCR